MCVKWKSLHFTKNSHRLFADSFFNNAESWFYVKNCLPKKNNCVLFLPFASIKVIVGLRHMLCLNMFNEVISSKLRDSEVSFLAH